MPKKNRDAGLAAHDWSDFIVQHTPGALITVDGQGRIILCDAANGKVLKVTAGLPAWETDIGAIAFPEVADAAARLALTAANGQGCFQLDTLAAYVCTVAG